MFDKYVVCSLSKTKIEDMGMEKKASVDELNSLDPEFLYIWVRAISAGEFWGNNKNNDWFSEKELLESYHTFMEAHVFKNHDNKDVAKAIGSVLKPEYNQTMHCVELLIKIDRVLAPEIVRAFEKGYSTDVSMGCRVNHTVCSICGNKAKTRQEFCEHVRFHRGEIMNDGKKVVEYNIGPRFHDISVVLNGADRTAKVLEFVKEASNVVPIKKIASLNENMSLEKVASFEKEQVGEVSISKLAEIQKQISDSLYMIAILDRLKEDEVDPADVEEFAEDIKEAGIYLSTGFEKQAGFFKNMRNIAIGTTGIALATNYYQGKRMRGDNLNPVQNFVADNPGTLPLAFAFGYPAAAKALRKAKLNAHPSIQAFASSDFKDELLHKEASVNHENNEYINIFNSSEVANSFKTAYHVNDDKLSMIKLATTLKALGDTTTVDTIKVAYEVSDSDLSNFITTGHNVIKSSLEKEASFLGNAFMSGMFTGNSKGGINPGLASAGVAGAMIDGYLLTKFLEPKKNTKPVVQNIQNENISH